MAESFQASGPAPAGRTKVQSSVASSGRLGSPETICSLARSTMTSMSEKRIATVAYSAPPSRQASDRLPCKSFTPESRLICPRRAWPSSSSAKYEAISGVAMRRNWSRFSPL
jgi:hypothetical protein